MSEHDNGGPALKPCPFCGNDKNIAIANERHDLSGGYYIACPACDASTGLRFSCGEDPRPLLVEQWNRRVPTPQPAPTALNGIAASMFHDEGAYSQCGNCLRYSLDPKTISSGKAPTCECGESTCWSGSFKKPGPDAKWNGAAPQEPQR